MRVLAVLFLLVLLDLSILLVFVVILFVFLVILFVFFCGNFCDFIIFCCDFCDFIIFCCFSVSLWYFSVSLWYFFGVIFVIFFSFCCVFISFCCVSTRNYIRMEGAREFQISVEYQIYCLFYCFGSSLKFKLCCRIWRQIQMDKSKVDGNVSSCQVKITG